MNDLEFKWGTPNPYVYNDSELGDVEILFRGVCVYSINNSNVNSDYVLDNLIQTILISINDIVNEFSGKKFNQLEQDLDNISNKLTSLVVSKFQDANIVFKEIKSLSISMTDNSKMKMDGLLQKQLEDKKNQTVVVQTDEGSKDGQNKCPKCGATEISLNVSTGKLKCRYCRTEFEPEKIDGLDGDISQLKGQVLGSGATDIIADTNDVVTFKCSSCGAEVVVDTSLATQAKCHWCRNMLSVNQQIPNGSVPDVVLPFVVSKEEAKIEIDKFVGKRKFFANPKFQKEFTTENIMGVYFPYMLVDVNSHVNLVGQGEHEVRKYYRGSGDNRKLCYDADLYHIEREFDLTIDDLSVESSSDRLNNKASDKTNNVINAIMPFDTENCVKWNANYIKGYTSEKRDTNIDQLRNIVETQSKDIARFSANETLKEYDRGVAWSTENLEVKGQQWKAAYLPVWLYSYQQINGDKKILHYVAVNARTKETMGSVPIHMPRLILISSLVELIGLLAMLFVDFEYSWIFLLTGFIYFFIMYGKYRNSSARHKHELETKKNMSNLRQVDRLIDRKTGLSNSSMHGANNTSVSGNNVLNLINNNIKK